MDANLFRFSQITFLHKQKLNCELNNRTFMVSVFNGSGPRKYEKISKSHFNPYAALFSSEDRPSIVLSDIGLIVALSVLCYFINLFNFSVVLRLYIVPYLVMNGFLVLITLLHHTDIYVPHFRSGEWSWLRGWL